MTPVDPSLRSFVPVEPDSHFPIQNLPYGVFHPAGGDRPRLGVALGEMVVDLAALADAGLLRVPEAAAEAFSQPSLNAFLALGSRAWRAVRARLVAILRDDAPELRDDAALRDQVLVPREQVELLLPVQIGDYTDFYSSRYHAENVGTMMRGPEAALQPNWLHVPVAYHGRASSVVLSGTDVRRPRGQTQPAAPGAAPGFGPSRALDYELEMGFFTGPGNPLGEPIEIAQAAGHIFGMVLVNDWSARDIQGWEYVPLGPFLSKNFATSISPWVVPLEALQPFRVAGLQQDPAPLPYLQSPGDWALDIQLRADLQPAGGEPAVICETNFRHMYWNICQQLAHHTVTGCNLRPGDLLASGTISGPTPGSRACLLERSWRGSEPLELPGGAVRRFLEDGDRVTITGWCQGEGYRVGFGEVTGRVLPA